MKIERTKNAARNVFFGWILKLYQIIVPFLMRTAMIYFMGVQYLGLNSLFTSVLQVLNLAELGVGSAMVYSMYKPIAEDDTDTICALMRLYKLYYRVIGCVIAGVGIILTPFIPNLISGDVPDGVNVYILYLLNLGTTVLSYWLFAYKNSILQAYQRVDVTSKVTLITSAVQYLLQFLALLLLRDYYVYVIVALFTQALTNVLTAFVSNKMYPNYKPRGKLDKEVVRGINHRIRDLFTAKLGSVIVNSVDTIVISAFLGLTVLAVYQNYYYILNSIIGVVAIIFTACTAGIGNSIVSESQEKNYNDLEKFTFLIAWLAGFCTCCLLCLYQPFMKIWVGEDLTLALPVVICMCAYYFIYEMNKTLVTFKDAAGLWHEDRFRPLTAALVNLALNLALVNFWGLYAIVLSTVISMLGIATPWLLYNLFTVLFDRKLLKGYLKKFFFYYLIVAIACAVTYFICDLVTLPDWPTFIIRGIICCIVPNIIFFIIYRNRLEFKQCLQLVDKVTHGKLHLAARF